MKYVLAPLLSLLAVPAFAQNTPVGLWKTIDDTTGREKGLVQIVDENGVLFGRIKGNLGPNPPARRICDLCSDDRKDKPLLGMVILRGVRQSRDETGQWDGGDILDPDTGKVYRVRLRPKLGGKELEVRGYLGISLFGRTQTWMRAE